MKKGSRKESGSVRTQLYCSENSPSLIIGSPVLRWERGHGEVHSVGGTCKKGRIPQSVDWEQAVVQGQGFLEPGD